MLHFATIITPDADPVKRKGVIEVLEKFFIEKNRRTRAESPRLGLRRLRRGKRRSFSRANWQAARGSW